jgi:hypothetical protein
MLHFDKKLYQQQNLTKNYNRQHQTENYDILLKFVQSYLVKRKYNLFVMDLFFRVVFLRIITRPCSSSRNETRPHFGGFSKVQIVVWASRDVFCYGSNDNRAFVVTFLRSRPSFGATSQIK